MDINTKAKMSKVWRILWKGSVGIFAVFSIIVVLRVLYVAKNTPEQVAKIHATKLTIDDVMGVNLPPNPGAEADKTVAGIDANENGIRDDVELAIFKEYPNSAKTRAVLLQYALALQMEMTLPILNRETATEVVREQSRAGSCIGDILIPRKSSESSRSYADVEKIFTFINLVKNKQLNTKAREESRNNFVKYVGGYSESENEVCDIDVSTLLN